MNQLPVAIPSPKSSDRRSSQCSSYRDYAGAQEAAANSDVTVSSAATATASANANANFPEKLHYVLSEMEKDGLQSIASWQPHGRSFVVHDVKRFEKEVLPL